MNFKSLIIFRLHFNSDLITNIGPFSVRSVSNDLFYDILQLIKASTTILISYYKTIILNELYIFLVSDQQLANI